MPDLEPQLRRYAEQLPVGPLPPFAAVRRRHRRRRQVRAGLAAVAVLLVAGGTTLTVRAYGGPDDLPPAATEVVPDRLTINGVPVERHEPTPVDWVQAANREARSLLVAAGTANRSTPDVCYPWTDVRVVAQGPQEVTLAANTYTASGAGPDVCTSEGRPQGEFRLELREPLGSRRIVQDGRDVHLLLTDTLLRAGVLPAGYADTPRFVEDGKSGTVDTRYPGPDPDTLLEISEGPRTQPRTDPDRTTSVDVLDRLTVRGHPAVLRQTTGFSDVRCLVWAETATTGVSVCSSGSPDAPLTGAQLATVAEGLVRNQ
jgi:hypothetical protein